MIHSSINAIVEEQVHRWQIESHRRLSRGKVMAQPMITVFALKAILKNNAVSGARALNRTEWLDAIKTATATIKVDAGRPAAAKSDMQYVYKVPFNYAWDIVIANSPCTLVAP